MLRSLIAFLVALAFLGGVAILTRIPWSVESTDRSMLRLSWRALAERTERCRPATAAELAGVPAHMRQHVICEDARVAPYRLRVALDRQIIANLPVTGSGERPLYVLHEVDVAPGKHHLDVRFEREVTAGEATTGDTSTSQREHDRLARQRAIPPRLLLDTTIVVPPNAVLLVTYSPEARRLVLVSSKTLDSRQAERSRR